jgi:hypothetical protein
MISVPRVQGYPSRCFSYGDLGYQISAASQCGDNTIDVDLKWLAGITRATTIDYTYRQEISKNNS